ncbi:hypothetical protein [Conexibacter sp. CPCC 206217]|uniref:hypothetical protein n=1 Tax=Conexibacter sp. CPCC 206217 TaxID=3064574 RepID=UPI00271C023A|nr:hypothetical protein [Conexibacter sp. CPCC 206217]MDO8211781.1 hypothetical protein [Conexibacter sp. CPCC 206217]
MARLTAPPTAPTHSLGIELERQRLAHRAARIRRALAAMHRLADARRDEVPAPLLHGMTDFDRELTRVEQRLRALDREVTAHVPIAAPTSAASLQRAA